MYFHSAHSPIEQTSGLFAIVRSGKGKRNMSQTGVKKLKR